jgi:hypothetical protein
MGHEVFIEEGRGGERYLRAEDICGRITWRWTLRRLGSVGWTGLGWLRIRCSGGLLWTRWWILGFHKENWIFFDKLTDRLSNNILHHGVI